MFVNPFVLPKNEYKRDINPVKHYAQQLTAFLGIMTGASQEECENFVRNGIKRDFHAVDPKVEFLEKQPNGDRDKRETTLMRYIEDSIRKEELIAPTLTTYINPKIKETLAVKSVEGNKAKRSAAKKEMFIAEGAGDKLRAAIKDIQQTNAKLSNNAYSGAMCTPSTPLHNPTGHSTLTSTCRSTSAYGNANNEKIISGNRHYWAPNIVINNIISIITATDLQALENVMYKYSLYYPSIEDTMECITYSTDLYWKSAKQTDIIKSLVVNLTPLQRAAFVYVGDLYHLRKHNDLFIRRFIEKLSKKVYGETIDDPLKVIKSIPEDYIILAHQVCTSEMKGKAKDYKKMLGTKELDTLIHTAFNIQNTLTECFDIIRAIFVTPNFPASVAYFPVSVRRSAVASDTDSTIFTVQDWVVWYTGKLSFDDIGIAVSATMIFLASQAITHLLAKMSANFGIAENRLSDIAMKSEFAFPVFCVTSVAKHYFASIGCQEGNVFAENKKEIKGVHLKSSNAPKEITKKAEEMMLGILSTVQSGNKIKILPILKQVGDIERDIFSSIFKGESKYLRLGKIKDPKSYKNPDRSPYTFHDFWINTFSSKYGFNTPPPYVTLKISTTMNNAADTTAWLDSIEDKDLVSKIKIWMVKNQKVALPSFNIPLEVTKMHGLPKEIISVIDVRHIVGDITNVFYIILETLGMYVNNDKAKVLISDMY